MPFNPARLTLARKRRGVTKRELAAAVAIAVRNIHRYEDGEAPPSSATLARIAEKLGFPVEFFSVGTSPPELPVAGASFRSLSTVTQRQRDAVIAAGQLAMELADQLESYLRLPAPDVPDLSDWTPADAARQLRAHWGLGCKPISNTVHLLESRGVRVFSLVEDCLSVDAFTIPREGIPYVFLNTMKSAERSRFDACHELAHIALHARGELFGREREREADGFASAFLMPEEDVIGRLPRLPSLADLVHHKKRWGVSVAALARRLFDLELLSEWHYKQLCIELSKRGYRKTEPDGQQRETSQLLRRAFELLRSKGISKSDIARNMGVDCGELDALVFSLVMTAVPNGSERVHRRPSSNNNPPKLRRVK